MKRNIALCGMLFCSLSMVGSHAVVGGGGAFRTGKKAKTNLSPNRVDALIKQLRDAATVQQQEITGAIDTAAQARHQTRIAAINARTEAAAAGGAEMMTAITALATAAGDRNTATLAWRQARQDAAIESQAPILAAIAALTTAAGERHGELLQKLDEQKALLQQLLNQPQNPPAGVTQEQFNQLAQQETLQALVGRIGNPAADAQHQNLFAQVTAVGDQAVQILTAVQTAAQASENRRAAEDARRAGKKGGLGKVAMGLAGTAALFNMLGK